MIKYRACMISQARLVEDGTATSLRLLVTATVVLSLPILLSRLGFANLKTNLNTGTSAAEHRHTQDNTRKTTTTPIHR